MGFNEADEKAVEKDTEDPAIRVEPMDINEDLREAAIPVDDVETVMDWDRGFPDMSVGTIYPSMDDFSMAVRQHAIVEEFE